MDEEKDAIVGCGRMDRIMAQNNTIEKLQKLNPAIKGFLGHTDHCEECEKKYGDLLRKAFPEKQGRKKIT